MTTQNNTNPTPENNEGMYLDAMNQLKEMNEKREKDMKIIKHELLSYKKEMMSVYGVVRLLDMIYTDSIDEPIMEISTLIETLREYLSQFVEERIINESVIVVEPINTD